MAVKQIDSDQNLQAQSKTGTLNKEAGKSFGNFHANHFSTGKEENSQQKVGRVEAMKRRMSKAL